MGKSVKVTKETETGLNQEFIDMKTGKEMTRKEFVKEIQKGKYPEYHIRKINNKKIPVSNPDNSEGNNLD